MVKIILLVLALLLFVLQQLAALDSVTPLMMALHNSAHLPWFALITFLIVRIVKPVTRDDLVRLTVLLVVLGCSSEVLQIFSKRDFSIMDILANLSGAILVLVLHSTLRWRWLIAFICVLIGLRPLIVVGLAYGERALAKPELLSPNAWLASHLILKKSELSNIAVPSQCRDMNSDRAYKILFDNDTNWPNIKLMDVVSDWRTYQSLSVVLCNVEREPLNVWLSIHSENPKRLPTYRKFLVDPGVKILSLPINTLLNGDVSQVKDIKIYVHRRDRGRSIVVSSVKLEPMSQP